MALIYLSGAWVAGIILGSNFSPPLAFVLTGLIPLPLLFFLRQRRKPIILASLSLFILFSGATYFQSSLPAVDDSSLQFYNDRGPVTIKGLVNRDPDVRDKATHLRISASEIRLDGE